jgi:3,4-dihydroxy 2-butanone 4-phosphate synthase/GTP cyclohydrolase II
VNRNVHLVLVKGDPAGAQPPLVRVHVQDTLGDVLGLQSPLFGWPFRSAIRRIANEGQGVLILLRYGESPRDLVRTVRQMTTEELPSPGDHHGTQVLRTYGTGAQILRDLGVTRMRVLSAPKQMQAISGFGLEVVEYVD